MKAADVRAMTVDQLDEEVLKLKKEQFNLRFQRATGQLENSARVRLVRRDIARMKTIASEKRGGISRPQPAPKPQAEAKPKKPKAAPKPKSEAKPKRESAKAAKAKAKAKKD